MEIKSYPFKFERIYHEKIWGSESWEVSGHKSDTSIIANGPLAGTDLNSIIKKHPKEILGEKSASKYSKFPLLIKILTAKDRLSIQVHPDDKYAKSHEHDLGKTEAWYVIDAAPGAKIICGLEKGATRDQVLKAIDSHTLEPHLNTYEVRTGDVIFIDPGTIHALEENITVYEVQEASDVTYRLYDWERMGEDGKPRELHIDDALNVIKFNDKTRHLTRPKLIMKNGYKEYELVSCDYFALERFLMEKIISRVTRDSFEVITAFGGEGVVKYDEGDLRISAGETILIPAALEKYEIDATSGHLEVLITHKPEKS